MASSAPTHDNLLAEYPEAEFAKCDGYGFVDVQYPGDKRPSRHGSCPACSAEKRRQEIEGFIPPRFRRAITLPDDIRAWADNGAKAQGLYIEGPVGTGKTHAAWGALARWCTVTETTPHGGRYGPFDNEPSRPNVVFTRMTDLLDSLRPGDDGTLRISDCQTARLLVLDDVGAEKATEWTQERIYSIIDHRYAYCLPLIITSNLPAADLAPQIGERAASRLAEMCGTVAAMTGDDRRWPA